MTTLHLRKSIDRSPLRLGFLLILLALTLLALSPTARAEDGGLPNDSTAESINALVNQNNSGFGNTAMGWNALGVLTSASFNTATGYKALLNNNGDNNTADGSQALANNTNGTWNTATGANALLSNTTGSVNTALGYSALSSNTNGTENTATGTAALFKNTSRIQAAITTRPTVLKRSLATLRVLTTRPTVFLLWKATQPVTTTLRRVSKRSRTIQLAPRTLLWGPMQVSTSRPAGTTSTLALPVTAGESKKIRIGKPGTQVATFIAGIYNVNEGGTIKPLYINRMVR